MRLLFLTPQLPYPPHQGTTLRNWGLISHLARRGHEIALLSFCDDLAAPIPPELAAICARVETVSMPARSRSARLRTLFTSALPDMAWRLWSPAFVRALAQLSQDFQPEITQIEGIELARYADALAGSPARRVVFDDHNCEYVLQQRACLADLRRPRRWHAAAYSFAQWRRLHAFESRVVRRAQAVLCVSEQDRAAIQRVAPGVDPLVIYNGIDVAGYALAEPGAGDTDLTGPPASGPHGIVFTGKMDFRPNIDAALWFAREILPLVRARVPDATFTVAGQKPDLRLNVVRALPGVTIAGAVPDIQPYIRGAAVYAAPLLAGGGTRFKLLEAMALGTAIVSTRLGCEGFAVTHSREMALADSAPDFAREIVHLLGDPGARAAMAGRARAFVAATYDWSAIIPRLEALYQRIV